MLVGILQLQLLINFNLHKILLLKALRVIVSQAINIDENLCTAIENALQSIQLISGEIKVAAVSQEEEKRYRKTVEKYRATYNTIVNNGKMQSVTKLKGKKDRIIMLQRITDAIKRGNIIKASQMFYIEIDSANSQEQYDTIIDATKHALTEKINEIGKKETWNIDDLLQFTNGIMHFNSIVGENNKKCIREFEKKLTQALEEYCIYGNTDYFLKEYPGLKEKFSHEFIEYFGVEVQEQAIRKNNDTTHLQKLTIASNLCSQDPNNPMVQLLNIRYLLNMNTAEETEKAENIFFKNSDKISKYQKEIFLSRLAQHCIYMFQKTKDERYLTKAKEYHESAGELGVAGIGRMILKGLYNNKKECCTIEPHTNGCLHQIAYEYLKKHKLSASYEVERRFLLATLLSRGHGVEKDINKALELIDRVDMTPCGRILQQDVYRLRMRLLAESDMTQDKAIEILFRNIDPLTPLKKEQSDYGDQIKLIKNRDREKFSNTKVLFDISTLKLSHPGKSACNVGKITHHITKFELSFLRDLLPLWLYRLQEDSSKVAYRTVLHISEALEYLRESQEEVELYRQWFKNIIVKKLPDSTKDEQSVRRILGLNKKTKTLNHILELSKNMETKWEKLIILNLLNYINIQRLTADPGLIPVLQEILKEFHKNIVPVQDNATGTDLSIQECINTMVGNIETNIKAFQIRKASSKK